MSLKIDFWGVRGSLPFSSSPLELYEHFGRSLEEYLKLSSSSGMDLDTFIKKAGVFSIGGYGSATTCVQVSSQNTTIIIDAGTGIKALGDKLLSQGIFEGGQDIHLFLTHFHWDHLLGLPSFKPVTLAENTLHIYAVEPQVEALLRRFLQGPWVDVPLQDWKCQVRFHVLTPRAPLHLHDMTITPYLLDHPDPCWGYKITSQGKTYSHCADTEGTRISPQSLGLDLALYQDVDLMYFDAQYTLKQLADRVNWGHSAAQIGLELAFRENIKRVVLSHHDPVSSPKMIQQLIAETQDYCRWKEAQALKQNLTLSPVQWSFVYEGQSITL